MSDAAQATAPPVTTVLSGSGYGVEISAGGHTLAADALPASGGDGAAPAPGELMLAALGSCTAMTVRMYADRKGWPIREIRLSLEKVRERAEPDHPRRDVSGMVTTIRERLEIDAPELDEDQMARLRDIATRCPVHQALAHGAVIETEHAAPA